MQPQATNSGGGPEINLARPDMSVGMIGIGPSDRPDYPDLILRGEHPGLGDIPDKGEATIKFSKQAHEVAKDPDGKKRHRVHLNVHSIKVANSKKKTIKDKNPFEEVPPALRDMEKSLKNNNR